MTHTCRECNRTFCPSYSQAVARDPVSNETEQFLSVGLNSGITKEEFDREKLNLIVVLDTSGSMSSPFDEYYYDEDGEKKRVEENAPKMDVATDSVGTLTRRLGEDDRIGIVTYDDSASTVQSLERTGDLDMDEVRHRVRQQRADGGTNLDAGMRTARQMAEDAPEGENRTTRVIYVTDAMPNLGDTGGAELERRMSDHAEDGIHTTFVGVGVDFNAELTESISTVEGANYYSVHSPSQFDERMEDGFSYMVTPLVYNLSLSVDAEGYDVEHVYGSPQADESTDELLHVDTLFPSRSDGNESEGSVILVELEETDAAVENREVTLNASYETPNGEYHETTREVTFTDRETPHYDDSGVRKAVVLTEYATLMNNWMVQERSDGAALDVEAEDGVERRELGQWEQQSVPLTVSSPYDDRIERFVAYFERHAEALGAEEFQQDTAVLERLATAEAEPSGDDGEE
jgi:Ca-activated chloride channel family protein